MCAFLFVASNELQKNSSFLNACRDFNADKITHSQFVERAVRQGFSNVIDAFHNVYQSNVPTHFYKEGVFHPNVILIESVLPPH